MATSKRKYDALVALLERDGSRFGFFHAVQLLHRLIPGTTPVGELGPPSAEPVRFRHDPNLVFHAGDIDAVQIKQSSNGAIRAIMTTTFLGLTGTASPLATVFSEDVLRAEAAEESSLRGFYDLFHHRLVSLFYRTWKKYRFTAGFRSDGSDSFSHRMLSFVGVDISGAVPRRGLGPFDLLALAPLLSMRTRPVRTLQIVLERVLPRTGIRIEPFVHRRVVIREEDRCLLARRTMLGVNFVIGKTVPDRSGRFRTIIGPVDYATFEALMPGGKQHAHLRDVILQFAPAHLEPEIELVLSTEDAPRFQLGAERGGRLGVTTHLPIPKKRGMRARVVLSESIAEAVPHLFSDDEPPPEVVSLAD
jgi:type VI secretion system protein ImpH